MEWVIPEELTAANLLKNSSSLREERADPGGRAV